MYKPEALHSSSYHIQANKFEDESGLLRDKSASCSHGLELTQRPTTVIGISQNRLVNRQNSIKAAIVAQEKNNNKKVIFEENNIVLKNYYNSHLAKETKNTFCEGLKPNEEKSVSVNSLNSLSGTKETIDFIDEAEDLTDRSNMLTKDNNEVEKVEDTKDKIIQHESVCVKTKVTKSVTTINNENISTKTENNVSTEEKITEINVKTSESVEFSDECVKYELGIPIVETRNTYIIAPEITAENANTDVPPKPPPRTSISDNYKPKYPADSPKPLIDPLKRHQNYFKDHPISLNQHKSEIVVQKPPIHTSSESVMSTQQHYQKNILDVPPDVIEHTFDFQTTTRKSDVKFVSTSMGKVLKSESETEVPKITTSTPKNLSMSKVSPTNSIVRAMMYSNKSRNGKKKNTLTAKKRKVSVNDVSPGDMEGFLYQRFRTRDGQKAYWDKLWFVLIGNRLYGFTSKESVKADVLIYLTGFTVCHATEVKSRSNAFKVYHTGTVFYFSAETHETTLAWIEYISGATLHSDATKPTENVLYSETDDSDSEKPKTPTEKTSEGIKKFGSLKKFTSKKGSDPSSHSGSTSLDRKWFFNKSTSSKNSVPVPTAQFRSYRKIPSTQMESVSTGNFTSHIPNFAARLEIQNFSSTQNISVPNLSVDLPKTEKTIITPCNTLTPKNKANNFSHSSNPSLYNVSDFHQFFPKSQHQTRENLAGFVTLEELMNRQTEEQKLNPLHNAEVVNMDLIKPDVVYGEVPIRHKGKPVEKKRSFKSNGSESKKEESESSSFCFGKKSAKKLSEEHESSVATYPKSKQHDLKNNRSLPRAHKLLESYDTYSIDSSKQYSDSCKSLTKLEDEENSPGYQQDEFGEMRIRRDSMEKLNRIEVINPNVKLKPAMQYTPLSLPLVDDKAKMNPKLAFELNLDEKVHKGGKLMSFFHKQSDSKKEKHVMGSPSLHRAIFRKPSSSDDDWRHQGQIQNQSHSTTIHQADKEDVTNQSNRVIQHVDYPGLEYPPVFEPETYSLSDPQSSLTILRKQGKN
ncbi:connector enchancer of kinase suppressor of ras [Holotrichia oblita]|uniref:Connector enchancer of kinase suppressor of ras n=1 Tax=Holotrichia oblita TaxID=644536 RepID=A0ACB9TCW4_HOLOL|nr:connector enchancer of kinase suppressor of ras [Holotrichia oblita]